MNAASAEKPMEWLRLAVFRRLGGMGSWLGFRKPPLQMEELSLCGEESQVTKEVYMLCLRELHFNSAARIFKETVRMSTPLRRRRA
jgi:hypothetical protein